MLSRSDAAAFAQRLRAAGKQVVFTNGVFDLIHPGHVRYLQEARSLGDALIVGVNADESVRRNKGEGRPVTPERERAELIAALACVDAVTVFEEDTPADVIRAIQPDVLVKGADWAADQIVGRDTVEALGGRVVRVAVEEGYSTTAILQRIREAYWELRFVVNRRADLPHRARQDDRHVVFLAGVLLRLREHLVFVLPLDDRVAAWHDVAAPEDLIRHVPPLREGGISHSFA